MTGCSFFPALHDGGRVPVIVMTARDQLRDRLAGLDGGADDYVVKPVEMPELIARCLAVSAPVLGGRSDTILRLGALELDTAARSVRVAGGPLALGRREMTVSRASHARRGTGPRRDGALEEAVYGFDDEVGPNALEASVSRLRRALAAAGCPRAHRDGCAVSAGCCGARGRRKVSGAARSGPPLAKVLARGLVVIAGVVFVVNSVAVGLYYGSDRRALEAEVVADIVDRLEAGLEGRTLAEAASVRDLFTDHPEAYAYALVDRGGEVLATANAELIPPGATDLYADDWFNPACRAGRPLPCRGARVRGAYRMVFGWSSSWPRIPRACCGVPISPRSSDMSGCRSCRWRSC